MRSSHLVRVVLPVVLLAASLGVGSAAADDVSDQQRRVEQIADQLDALENRIGQLAEDHAAALDRLDELAVEITEAQASVDAKNAELATVQGQLTSVALDSFVSGGAALVSPLFSSIDDFTDDLARTELARVALDQGAGTSDEMQALIADLATEQAALQAKQAEQTTLVADIEARQAEGDQLTVQYQQDYAAAQAELGDLIRQEQERRLAAAVAAAQRAAENSRPATPPARGGGATPPAGDGNDGNGNDGNGNGGDTGGGSTPAPTPDPTPAPPSAPPPASTAGIAVGAAQSQLGVSYRFAAESPGEAFDCSGLTKWAWGRAGVYLPHQSARQYASTPHVSQDEAQPGDLVFYHSPIGHVGIYIGGGQMIHATQPGDVVKVSPVRWNKVVGVSRPG
ncbi:MAG: NlpC/P60 family protein [Actinomycetota bacterium]